MASTRPLRPEEARAETRPRPEGAEPEARPAKRAPAARAAAPRLRQVAMTDLDRVIHERMRLGIVSSLAVSESLSFNELKEILGTTDGNLSVHARKLEEAGYVACRKSFAGRTPRTEYRLTDLGRQALQRYLDHMEALIRATRSR